METVYRDYAPRGVKFFYLYKALAHPETNGYVTPYTQQERLMHVKEARRRLGSEIPWLCDTMENETKHLLGDAPNSEFIIDPAGKIARRRAWSSPEEVRRDLEELVGPVERITQVADLQLKTIPPPKLAASGVVPRLQLNGRFQPLEVTPLESRQPFYAKLRAEADEALLRTGSGRLYLGFLLDPLYGVHWNNLAAPLKFQLTLPEGVTASPANAVADKVEEPADVDPREFVVEIEGSQRPAEPLKIKVNYFACHDEEAWCKLISQEYLVTIEVDRDGGRVQTRGRQRPGQSPTAKEQGGPPFPLAKDQIFGTIASIDREAQSLVINVQGAEPGKRAIVIKPEAPIRRNRRVSKLDDLQPGDRVLLQLERSDQAEIPVAIRVMARG